MMKGGEQLNLIEFQEKNLMTFAARDSLSNHLSTGMVCQYRARYGENLRNSSSDHC